MYVVWTSPRTAGIWSPWYERCTRPLARFWWHRVRVECKGNRCYTGVAKVDHGTQTHQPRGRLETFRVAWQVKLDWLGWLDLGILGIMSFTVGDIVSWCFIPFFVAQPLAQGGSRPSGQLGRSFSTVGRESKMSTVLRCKRKRPRKRFLVSSWSQKLWEVSSWSW